MGEKFLFKQSARGVSPRRLPFRLATAFFLLGLLSCLVVASVSAQGQRRVLRPGSAPVEQVAAAPRESAGSQKFDATAAAPKSPRGTVKIGEATAAYLPAVALR